MYTKDDWTKCSDKIDNSWSISSLDDNIPLLPKKINLFPECQFSITFKASSISFLKSSEIRYLHMNIDLTALPSSKSAL
jgi:hypothetical protein